ncbi:hypothetical protein GCM10011342_04920 [Aquisalinus flavus]|uniref:Uncharacterized protein n=2 Tax=Aquisalinus flavus TaxID=1526572 RepID=A0A8J2V3T2_9PROT|nr:hypothetical protein GCM10011342_04920 [Aquisalinus flavus]
MMLADGQAVATSQEYAKAYQELKDRMEGTPTADQLNRFQNFPKPVLNPSRNAEGGGSSTAFVLTYAEPMDRTTVEDSFAIRGFTGDEDRSGKTGEDDKISTSSSTSAAAKSGGGTWYVGGEFSSMIIDDEEPGNSSAEGSGAQPAGLEAGNRFLERSLFGFGVTSVDIPRAGFGVEVTTEDERFVAETDGTLSGTTFGGLHIGDYRFTPRTEYDGLPYLQRKWRGRANAFMAGFTYTQADGSSRGSVPVGGNGTGVVYFDFADDNATGLFFGSAGSDVETNTDFEGFRFNAGRKVYHGIDPDWYWGCYHGFFYDYSDTEHEFEITTPSYSDIYTLGRQDLTERYAGFEAGPFFGRQLGNASVHFRPLFNFGYREADLDAQQDTFCGACYYSQTVPIRLDEDDSGLTYGASVDAGLQFAVTERFSLGAVYQARWRADSAAIVNPESGDDLFIDNQPTRLATGERTEQQLLFTVGNSW